MDFFGSQEAARRRTGLLIFYFVIAVVLMILTLYTVAVVALSFANSSNDGPPKPFSWYQPEIFLLVSGGTLTIITLGSLYKTAQLSSGGSGVAEQLGGRRLHSNSRDPVERRLLNVVEEMALAAGTPVPAVYLLDNEPGINAFAAGFTPGDAVIGVNRGTVEQLSRDELQGVIAHEFSHILNGDMRLNIRLMGLLHGILLIALVGYIAMRTSGGSSRNKGAGQIVLIGLAMVVIGYVGLFFARLIKASVSRQREYLADASAVQFTRNPDGIGGALIKIGALSAGSRMVTPAAEGASHMFFGSFRNTHFLSLATHPPLEDRVRRIIPQFDGDFSAALPKPKPKPPKKEKVDPKSALEGLTRPLGGLTAASMGSSMPIDPVIVMAAIGSPTTAHVEYAQDLLARLPERLRDLLHDQFSCRCVVAAMLLDENADIRARQLQIVHDKLGEPSARETDQLAPMLAAQDTAARLPMIEVAGHTLQELSPTQYATFRETIVGLVQADDDVDLFEFVLYRVLVRRLDHHFNGTKPKKIRYLSVNAVRHEVSLLISALAYTGHKNDDDSKSTFEQASADFSSDTPLEFKSRDECSVAHISDALNKIEQSSAAIKKRVLNSATIAVMADGMVTTSEGELLRAIADSLDCPMPPLLADDRS